MWSLGGQTGSTKARWMSSEWVFISEGFFYYYFTWLTSRGVSALLKQAGAHLAVRRQNTVRSINIWTLDTDNFYLILVPYITTLNY